MKLSKTQKKQITYYYAQYGYKNVKLYWHKFYMITRNDFSVRYMPDDIFHTVISNAVNDKRQWPALLDKNLLDTIFVGFNQPKHILKNINGFYYSNGNQISKIDAIKFCNSAHQKLVIKPSIESGGGQGVIGFFIKDEVTDFKQMPLVDMFDLYKKDFIVQEVVDQHAEMKKLNPSSLNTIRIISYMKAGQVYVLSSIVRVGKMGLFTDNVSTGGLGCGIKDNGNLKEYGYFMSGEKVNKTDSGMTLKDAIIPNYANVLKMVNDLHFKIPYFGIVSWDIGIDTDVAPVLIEYNTYMQNIVCHQLANGPLFGSFTDEILELAKDA